MTAPGPGGRRVLVAVDASPASLEALAGAAALAELLDAGLEGLFVEDVNLLRASELPLATLISWPGGEGRPLDRATLEGELRALAHRARQALAAVAGPRQLDWSFRVARGLLEVEVLAAARLADLAVVGRVGRHGLAGPGWPARPSAPAAPGPAPGTGPVLVVHDGSEAADRALALAGDLPGGAGVVLLVPAETAEEAARVAAGAWRRHGRGTPGPYRWAGGRGIAAVVRAAQASGAALVVPAASGLLSGGGLARLLERAGQPVLLVR